VIPAQLSDEVELPSGLTVYNFSQLAPINRLGSLLQEISRATPFDEPHTELDLPEFNVANNQLQISLHR
jgi:hypothetical protein